MCYRLSKLVNKTFPLVSYYRSAYACKMSGQFPCLFASKYTPSSGHVSPTRASEHGMPALNWGDGKATHMIYCMNVLGNRAHLPARLPGRALSIGHRYSGLQKKPWETMELHWRLCGCIVKTAQPERNTKRGGENSLHEADEYFVPPTLVCAYRNGSKLSL